MKIIELCRINQEFNAPHTYKADGRKINKSRYETLEALSQRDSCMVTVFRKGNYHHFKTVNIPESILELSASPVA